VRVQVLWGIRARNEATSRAIGSNERSFAGKAGGGGALKISVHSQHAGAALRARGQCWPQGRP
ncbi:MAG: hypothetical protein PF443_00265, partial [Allgaiera sp.]|nr:hypothetical protein [Allgaiera sp.]